MIGQNRGHAADTKMASMRPAAAIELHASQNPAHRNRYFKDRTAACGSWRRSPPLRRAPRRPEQMEGPTRSSILTTFSTRSKRTPPVSAIWQVNDKLCRPAYALLDGQPVSEFRVGLKFGFPLNFGRPDKPGSRGRQGRAVQTLGLRSASGTSGGARRDRYLDHLEASGLAVVRMDRVGIEENSLVQTLDGATPLQHDAHGI